MVLQPASSVATSTHQIHPFFTSGSFRDSKKWAHFNVAPAAVDAGCVPICKYEKNRQTACAKRGGQDRFNRAFAAGAVGPIGVANAQAYSTRAGYGLSNRAARSAMAACVCASHCAGNGWASR